MSLANKFIYQCSQKHYHYTRHSQCSTAQTKLLETQYNWQKTLCFSNYSKAFHKNKTQTY